MPLSNTLGTANVMAKRRQRIDELREHKTTLEGIIKSSKGPQPQLRKDLANVLNELATLQGVKAPFAEKRPHGYAPTLTKFGVQDLSMPRNIPKNMSLEANIKLAQDMNRKFEKERDASWTNYLPGGRLGNKGKYAYKKLSWFRKQVQNGGPWDYKLVDKKNTGKYEAFGNWHYGVVGAAYGIPTQVLLRAAGQNQRNSNNSQDGWGAPWGGGSYGDDPVDQAWIKAGIEWYQANYVGKVKK